jgi:hypothetical protein
VSGSLPHQILHGFEDGADSGKPVGEREKIRNVKAADHRKVFRRGLFRGHAQ